MVKSVAANYFELLQLQIVCLLVWTTINYDLDNIIIRTTIKYKLRAANYFELLKLAGSKAILIRLNFKGTLWAKKYIGN